VRPFQIAFNIFVRLHDCKPDVQAEKSFQWALHRQGVYRLNMTCGQYLTRRFGGDSVFDFTVPRARPLDVKNWLALARNEQAGCSTPRAI